MTQTQLAKKYDVAQQSISHFAKRHADEIKALIVAEGDKFAGIAIADQTYRISLYQDLIARLTAAGCDEKAISVATRAMRNVAEELGALPTRVQLQGELAVRTNYTVNGVTPEDLT